MIRKLILLICCCGIALVGLFPAPILGQVARFLTVDQEPIKADAIVPLLGSPQPDRIIRAYELFQEGFAPRFVFATNYLDTNAIQRGPAGLVWSQSHDVYLAALRSIGVNQEQIVMIPGNNAADTATELHAVSNYAVAQGWKSLLLVSSASHCRRVAFIWGRVGDPSLEVRIIASPQLHFPEWWKSVDGVKLVVYELGAFAKEFLRKLYPSPFKTPV